MTDVFKLRIFLLGEGSNSVRNVPKPTSEEKRKKYGSILSSEQVEIIRGSRRSSEGCEVGKECCVLSVV